MRKKKKRKRKRPESDGNKITTLPGQSGILQDGQKKDLVQKIESLSTLFDTNKNGFFPQPSSFRGFYLPLFLFIEVTILTNIFTNDFSFQNYAMYYFL